MCVIQEVQFNLEQPRRPRGGAEVQLYCFIKHSARWGGQRHAPAALPPGKTRYPLYRRLSGPQGRSEEVRKISPRPGFDPRTVQPEEQRYHLHRGQVWNQAFMCVRIGSWVRHPKKDCLLKCSGGYLLSPHPRGPGSVQSLSTWIFGR
jgi:hypothetical protein